MFSLKTVICCLNFALLAVAPLPPPAPPGIDPCGPFNHQGDAGFNTCFSAVVPGGPAAYGIVCGTDDAVTVRITVDKCASAAAGMCRQMATGALSTGEWHWTEDYNGPQCRVGVFLPTDIAGAPVPNYRRCLNQIFQPLILSCMNNPPFNVGTVNILQLPNVTIPFAGETVNPSYPAYVVSPMALYHSVDPPATANVFGDPASGFSVAALRRQQRLIDQNQQQQNQSNAEAVNVAGGAGAEDRAQADAVR
ncbi:MAG: hypothetical protein Q9226_003603 [Calogaya cf. arnoldii]